MYLGKENFVIFPTLVPSRMQGEVKQNLARKTLEKDSFTEEIIEQINMLLSIRAQKTLIIRI